MESTGHNNEVQRHQLKKSVVPAQAWALAVGAIIGWGCFVLPGIRFLPFSGPVATLIGLGLGVLAMCIVALCYGIMVKAYPVAGGAFVYAFMGSGRIAAVICGWGLALSYSCVIAINCTALLLLINFLAPGVLHFGYLYTIADWEIYLGEIGLLSLLFIFFAYMNYRGAHCANNLQLLFSLSLVVGVLVLLLGSLTSDTSNIQNMEPFFNEENSPFVSVILVLALAPFLYQGFDTIPQTAEEFSFDTGKSTMLMILSIVCGGLLYAFTMLAVSIIQPYPEMLAAKHSWLTGTVAEMAFGRIGGMILAIPVMAGIFSGMNGYFIATSRILFSMGRSKFIPAWFEKLDPKHGTPVNAIIFILAFTLAAAWCGRPVLVWLTDTCALTAALSYFFTCATAYKLYKKHPELVSMPMAKAITITGSVISLTSFFLLMLPFSPAAISIESWYLLVFWVIMGVIFYRMRLPELKAIPVKDMQFMLTGDRNSPLLFDNKN